MTAIRRGTRTRATRGSQTTPEPSDDQLRLIRQFGWTLTAASYIRAMHFPAMPAFPIDVDILAEVPDNLPGDVPDDLADLLAASNGTLDLDAFDDIRLPDVQDLHDEAVVEEQTRKQAARARRAAGARRPR